MEFGLPTACRHRGDGHIPTQRTYWDVTAKAPNWINLISPGNPSKSIPFVERLPLRPLIGYENESSRNQSRNGQFHRHRGRSIESP
jgi:hypothetical protein